MFVFLFLFRLSPSRWWQFWDVFCYSLSPPSLGWQFCFMYIYDCLHWLVWCDAKLVDLVYSFFQNCKISLNTFSCRFQIAKPLNMIGDIFSFSKPWIVNFFFPKMDILSLVLKTLNFEDKISIRRGECNSLIKTNLFIKQNHFHKECLTKAFYKAT
jgi:hypothetical protein